MEKKTKEKKDMNGEQGHGRSHARRALNLPSQISAYAWRQGKE